MAFIYSAGGFEVRPAERRVLKEGDVVALGARAFDVLMALIDRRERVVGKDELLAAVWPGVAVEENNLTVQISAVRKALDGCDRNGGWQRLSFRAAPPRKRRRRPHRVCAS